MSAKNILGEPLQPCSMEPLTGYFRDGCCNTDDSDGGLHLVCAVMTQEFLEYSREQGNDLMTPAPMYRFPGLKPGDRWCLCVERWREALRAGIAPQVVLAGTHENVLKFVKRDTLEIYAIDAPPLKHTPPDEASGS